MSWQALADIPVPEWAAETCVLALWATFPKLPSAIRLMNAWGFQYRTGAIWLKNTPSSEDLATGVGIWFMGNPELILFGVRGKPSNFKSRRGRLNIFEAERNNPAFWLRVSERTLLHPKARKHSHKPTTLQGYLETFDGPYLELFATEKRIGWTCIGQETGWNLSERGVDIVAAPKAL